jgi:hypothetical protein
MLGRTGEGVCPYVSLIVSGEDSEGLALTPTPETQLLSFCYL